MDDRLRRLQLCELEILDEFVRVCEKHGLRYYLVGGTLLGAVRHKGFIPWDDDIDVAMPREDYDRFAQLCAEELDERYFYQSPDTDPHYFLSYAKVRRNGTQVYEERFKDARFHKGVFIDIFPLDACPRPGIICHLLFNVLAVMNKRGEADSGARIEPYTELSGKIGFALLRLFSPRGIVRLRRWLIALARRLKNERYIASFSGAYGYHREIFEKGWFSDGSAVEFEGRSYLAPKRKEDELTQIYGDGYMNLPPPEQRRAHIKTGEYDPDGAMAERREVF